MCTAEENPTAHSRSVELADTELKTRGLSRRHILQSAGILAAGTAASAAMARPAMANPGGNDPQLTWLVGDHHVHTQFSHDTKYMIKQQPPVPMK